MKRSPTRFVAALAGLCMLLAGMQLQLHANDDPPHKEDIQDYHAPEEQLQDTSITVDHVPGVADASSGDQIVAIAVAENGRYPDEVGVDLTYYPYDIKRYLVKTGTNEHDYEAWCSEFVAWAYRAADSPFTGGYEEGGWMLKGSYPIRSWFIDNREFIDKSSPKWSTFTPQPGDYVRYDNEWGGHSGIVRYVQGTSLYTVEGNVGNKVRLRIISNWRDPANSIDGIGVRNPGPKAPTGLRVVLQLE